MPTETEQQNEVIDLGYDADEADIARPVLQGGTVKAKIVRTFQDKTSQKQANRLNVVYTLTQSAKDTRGNDVNPGFQMYQRIIMDPTGGLTKDMIKARTSQIHFAVGGKAGEKPNTGNWIGKEVLLRVSLREAHTDKETGQSYDESNEIVRVMPVK